MIYSKKKIIIQLEELGIKKKDTLLVHSSMKSIGEVENGAEGVLDAFIEFFTDGLLIFPTHTWATINVRNSIYDPETEPSCVGILSNLFMKRQGVMRSWHPTHSVAALGQKVEEYIRSDDNAETPCPRNGCWGKLYDMGAKILFLGCSLNKNTIIHGVEEWNEIPMRLTEKLIPLRMKITDGTLIERPLRGHNQVLCDISENYDKIEDALLKTGIAQIGIIGDAKTYLCDVRNMVDLASSFLERNPDLFIDKTPIPGEWY